MNVMWQSAGTVAEATRAKLSVLILTKNEEAVIARAIHGVTWADEILVVDSGSTDRTVEIAESLGARVVRQPWLGWVEQHRFVVEQAAHDWVFSLDADEVLTPELALSLQRVLASGPDPRDGYALHRAEEFLGRIMPNSRRRTKRLNFIRLFNRLYGNWDPQQVIHEEVRVPGRAVMLNGVLLHWRNYRITEQMRTLNGNSDLEAEMLQKRGPMLLFGLVCKPALRFGWIYLVHGAWRYGGRGFIWAGLHATAEFLRHAKAWEALHSRPAPHPPGFAVEPPPKAAP